MSTKIYEDISLFPNIDNKGDVTTVRDKDSIKQSLLIIFNTPKGSRLMLPDFGCDVHSYLFEPFDEITARALATEIKNAFQYFEPRIRIKKVNVNMNSVDGLFYDVEVKYKIVSGGEDTLELTLEKL